MFSLYSFLGSLCSSCPSLVEEVAWHHGIGGGGEILQVISMDYVAAAVMNSLYD